MEITHDQQIGTSASANGAKGGIELRSIRIEDVYALRDAPSWPQSVSQLVSTVLEDGEFEETYATITSFMSSAHQPDVNIILQLYAIVLNPSECLKHFADVQSTDILASSPASASLRAFQLLNNFLHTNGHWRLLCNLPRLSQISGLPPRRKSMLDTVARKEDLSEFTRGELAARKLDRYRDVWEIVASDPAAEKEDGPKPVGPVSEAGQRILDILISAWEWEAVAEHAKGRPPASNFLLSQIRQPPTELPKDFRPIFEIILHPYQSGALGRASWMSEADRSTRLLHLMAQLAEAGKIDTTSFLQELCERMRDLGNAEFREFVAATLDHVPNTKIRLFARYIDKYSAPPPPAFDVDDSPPSSRRKVQSHADLSDYESEITFVKTVASSPSKASTPPSSQTGYVTSKRTPSKSSTSIAIPAPSPRRIGQSSQSSSPTKKAVIEPILTPPKKAIASHFDKMPKELDPHRPIKRVPKREGESQPAVPAVPARAIEAEIRFTLLKLEILQILVKTARSGKDAAAIEAWKKAAQTGKLRRAFKVGRKHLLREGELPKQIQQLEKLEDVILSAI